MNSYSSSSSAPIFNFVHFINFLTDKDILSTAVAAVISYGLKDVTESFIGNIIMPIINKDSDKDGERDFKKIEEKDINIYNIRFKIGKLTIDVLKFVILLYLLFIIQNIITSVNKKKFSLV